MKARVSYRLPDQPRRRFAVVLRRDGDYFLVTGGHWIHKRYVTFQT